MATQTTLLKYRNYEEHDVINLYSTLEGALPKGTVLEYFSADPDNQNGFGDSFGGTPGYAFSRDYVVNWKVQAAPAYSKKIAGLLLHDVITTMVDPWSVDARFVDPAKLAEKQAIVSGRAAPFVTKGWFEASGFDTSSGNMGAGSGLYLSHSGGGMLAVGNPNIASDLRTRLGTFMTSSGAYGAAVFRFNPQYA